MTTRIGISEHVLFPPNAKNKDYVDISKSDPDQMLYALLELYQVSSLTDIKHVKVFSPVSILERAGQ